jgi:biopolymer transport protein ExbB
MIDLFFKGGPIMYPLLMCSIIALTVIIERTIFWIGEDYRRDQALVNEVLSLAERGNWETVRARIGNSKDFIIRILVAGILHRQFSMSKAMETAASDELDRMRQHLPVLDTIITISPLLGIFGTVVGIILSFEILGSAGIEEPQAVTAGIAQALITTASGLGIAILSLFPFNYFNSKVEKAAATIEKYATSLEIVYNKRNQSNSSGEKEVISHEG